MTNKMKLKWVLPDAIVKGRLVYYAAIDGVEDYQISESLAETAPRTVATCWRVSRDRVELPTHKRRAFASAQTLKEAKLIAQQDYERHGHAALQLVKE